MGAKKYTIRLDDPCSFGWENMTAANKGRHCAECDKVVIDFTAMSDEELIRFLLQNKNICGHFNKSQVNRIIIIEGPKKIQLRNWAAVAAMLVAGFFSVVPLNAQSIGNPGPQQKLNGNIAVVKPEAPQPNTSIDKYSEKDSTITIGIKVIDKYTKKPVGNASIAINDYKMNAIDKPGYYEITLVPSKIPKHIFVSVSAPEYNPYRADIDVDAFRKDPYYVIELQWIDPKEIYDGKIMIKEH